MEKKLTVVPVVAVALIRDDGRVLMQKRAKDREHAGLWEFPGGKIEAGESPKSAIMREIGEELGIMPDADALVPLAWSAEDDSPNPSRGSIVILLYTCRSWAGDPQCLDGDELGWFAVTELSGLVMPPLDRPLAEALKEMK